MMCMDKIIKHKDAYIRALESAISGNEPNVSFPRVDSTSPYYTELNEEQEVSSFAYEVGKTLRGNIGGSGGGGNNSTTIPNHNHDDRYAKIVHNHDDRYYTKIQIDEWRDRLINGDLLFNKINSKHIQAGTIVAGSTIIANGAIGDAQISKVSADKLDAGVVNTSKVTISGANGNLKLRGNRLQVFEGIGSSQFERVSLGDVNNDGTVYGLRVRGADGNTILYDENGVYREGITDGSINNDKISGDANIDGGKLNIHSVIENINENNTGTIHGTKIDINGESVTSKVYNIELNQNEHSETIERQQSEIDQNKEQIKLKVSNQKYQEDMSSMTSRLDKTESDISVLNDGIKLTVSKTELQNQITEVKDFVADEIGEISVGGANYLNNSAPRKATVDEYVTWDRTLNGNHRLVYWQDYNDSVELPQVGYHPHIDLKTFHFPCIAFINRNATFDMANRELSLRHEIYKADEVIVPDETYVISFDAYSDTELFSFHGGLYHKVVESYNYGYHSGRMDISIEKPHLRTWQRYSMSFTTHKGIDTSQPMYLVINGHNNPEGSGYIKNIKLEKSNIVSQWTPSQFDVDDSLNDVVDSMKDYTNKSIVELNTNISIELDGISNKVEKVETSQNTLKNDFSNLDIKVDGISGKVSSIETNQNDLKNDFSSLDIKIDGVSSKVSSIENSVNSTVNGINVLTSRVNEAESKLTKDSLTTTIGNYYTTSEIVDGIVEGKGYQTSSQVKQEVDNLQIKFSESGGYNLFKNSSFKNDLNYWGISGDVSDGNISILDSVGHFAFKDDNVNTIQIFMQNKSNKEFGIKQNVNLVVGKVYSIDFSANGVDCGWGSLILEKDGAVEHIIHFDPLENGGGFNKWMDVEFSFTATSENYTIKIALRDAGNSGHMWIAKPNLVEGIRKVWTPNPNEIYGNVIRMDRDGLKINHSDNSKGVYDAKGITYYNSQGIKTSAIADGRFSTIDNEGNVIGYTGKSIWKGTDTHLTSLDACYGSTVGLGATISGNGDTVIPLVVASQGMLIGDTWMQQGLNIFSPRTFEKQTFFRKNIGIESVTMEQYADDLDYGVIVGSNGVNMGVIHDNQSNIGFCIEKNLNYYTKCIVQCHTDLNMNNFSILNANVQYSLIDTLSGDDNGITIDKEKQIANIDLAKVIYRLSEENEMLKKHQLEQDEILIENAFEIANMKLGGL